MKIVLTEGNKIKTLPLSSRKKMVIAVLIAMAIVEEHTKESQITGIRISRVIRHNDAFTKLRREYRNIHKVRDAVVAALRYLRKNGVILGSNHNRKNILSSDVIAIVHNSSLPAVVRKGNSRLSKLLIKGSPWATKQRTSTQEPQEILTPQKVHILESNTSTVLKVYSVTNHASTVVSHFKGQQAKVLSEILLAAAMCEYKGLTAPLVITSRKIIRIIRKTPDVFPAILKKADARKTKLRGVVSAALFVLRQRGVLLGQFNNTQSVICPDVYKIEGAYSTPIRLGYIGKIGRILLGMKSAPMVRKAAEAQVNDVIPKNKDVALTTTVPGVTIETRVTKDDIKVEITILPTIGT